VPRDLSPVGEDYEPFASLLRTRWLNGHYDGDRMSERIASAICKESVVPWEDVHASVLSTVKAMVKPCP
jgi:hypothetical protein